MANVMIIPFKQAAEALPYAKDAIRKSLEKANSVIDPEDMFRGVLSGEKSLWCITGDDGSTLAWALSEIMDDVAFIWCLGGTGMEVWFDTHTVFEDWAREHDCRGVQFYGRPGWQRVLKEYGFKPVQVVMHKEL